MAWNGSGLFVRLFSWVNDRDASIPITASRMDDEMDGIATGISNCIAKDGQNSPSANLPMGNFHHTGVSNATARDQYSAAGQVQDGAFTYAADTGVADAYAISLAPVITAYATGQVFRFKPLNTNTGASTLAVNGLAAQSIKKFSGTDLNAGDINANEIVTVVYDGTNFQCIDASINSRVIRLSDMTSFQDVAAADLVDNYQFSIIGYDPGSDVGGGTFYFDSSRSKNDHNGGTVISGTVPWDGLQATKVDFRNGVGETDPGGTGVFVRKYDSIYVSYFGAVLNDLSAGIDNEPAIRAAQAFAATLPGITEVYLGGQLRTDAGVNVINGVHLCCGQIEYFGTVTGERIVGMGDNAAGVDLVRTSYISLIRVKDNAGLADTVGIQIGNYVRTSGVKFCVAEMSEPVGGTLGQVGFEIASWFIGAPGITNAGTYGNTISECLALFAHTGFQLRTFGTKAEATGDPQANGNFIRNCHAFSCRRRAAYIGYGAQENHVDFRADTFPSQTGLGTTVNVLDVDGRYNTVHMAEEVGAIADTQYSVRLGDEAIYNDITFSTQQIVTGAVDDSANPVGKRGKNIIRQVGTGLLKGGRGGSEGTEGFYDSVAAGQTTAVQKLWIAPQKCVITKFSGRLNATAPTGGSTHIYFAKNSVFTTTNRVSWADSEAVSVKTKDTDAGAATDLLAEVVLDAGDFISMAVTTPGGGGVTAAGTFWVKYI